MTNVKMLYRTGFAVLMLLVGAVSIVMECMSLSRGNWIGGFFLFPLLAYLSLDKAWNLLRKR
jgi:hypothetical protein